MVWMLIHLTTIIFLCHQPEDGRTTGRNMLVNILLIKKYIIKVKCVCWLFIHSINHVRHVETEFVPHAYNL